VASSALAIILVTACWFGSSGAFAQSEYQPLRGGKNKPSHDPQVANSMPLSKAPDFPDVPPYNGRDTKFLDGISHPDMKGGRKCVQGRYQTKEDSQTVLHWYSNALKSSGWTMEADQRERTGIAARKDKDGLIVFVHARDMSSSGYRCEFVVRYLVVPPPPMPNKGAG
jgi:hypothetical protein